MRAISTSPGPPSDWYLRCQGVPVAWRNPPASGAASICRSNAARDRSARRSAPCCAPNSPISQCATGMPNAATMRAHSHSFSTEVRMSAWPLPTSPSGSLKMCVVGVEPMGRHQRPLCLRNAVFSCAPAMEMRKSSCVAAGRSGRSDAGQLARDGRRRQRVRVDLADVGGCSSGGSNCTAPTQSRPMAASRSNAPRDAAWKRSCRRRRIGSLSGSRLSKYASTAAPLCSARRRASAATTATSGRASVGRHARPRRTANSMAPREGRRHSPTRTPFAHTASARSRGARHRLPLDLWFAAGALAQSVISRPSTLSSASSCSTVRVSGRDSSSDKRFWRQPQRDRDLGLREIELLAAAGEGGAELRWRVDGVHGELSVIAIPAVYRQYR